MAVNPQEAQSQGEMNGGESAHVSYVKHLSSDQNLPEAEGGQGGSFIDKVPGGWWTIGIGGATVIIGLLTLHKMGQSNGTAPSGSQAYYPYSTDTTSGSSQSTGGAVAGAMDSQLTGILSQEQINNQVLQSILGNLSNNGTTTPAPNPSGSGPHFWVYTTKKGDTLNSLNKFAHWGSLNSLNQSGNNVYKYAGNQSIFQNYGIKSTNQKLPAGIKIRL